MRMLTASARTGRSRWILSTVLVLAATSVGRSDSFEAPKFGLKAEIPTEWPINVREKDDRIFVAAVPQGDPERPGVAACELGLAPESLDEYRTRIDSSARRGQRPGWTL